jgi:hypothetical protein
MDARIRVMMRGLGNEYKVLIGKERKGQEKEKDLNETGSNSPWWALILILGSESQRYRRDTMQA